MGDHPTDALLAVQVAVVLDRAFYACLAFFYEKRQVEFGGVLFIYLF